MSSHGRSKAADSNSAAPEAQERHVLLIGGSQRQAIALEASTYAIGREGGNGIILDSDTVSRQHALLLRVPVPQTEQYRYRLVDGNAEGKASTNGVFVNGQRCSFHTLNPGDIITFGHQITAVYQTLALGEAEFASYLEAIATGTASIPLPPGSPLRPEPQPELSVAFPAVSPAAAVVNPGIPAPQPAAKTLQDTVQLQPLGKGRKLAIGIAIAVILATTGIGKWWSVFSAQPTPAPGSVPALPAGS